MLDIPEIFHQNSNPAENLALPVIQSDSRWTEFVAHLSQFGEMDIPDTRDQLEILLAQEGSPAKRAVLITGISKCTVGEGKFLEGAQLLGYAYSLLTDSDGDSKAFVLLEMVSLLAIIGSYDNALMLLRTVDSLTDSFYLKKIANYYGLVNVGRKGDAGVIEALKNSADYFKSINSTATLAYHYKNIGNIYGKLKEFDETESWYNKALSLVDETKFKHIRAAVLHDMGMLRYRQSDFESAIELLQQSHQMADSFYTKAYTIGNMGFLYYQQKKRATAMVHFEKALDIATQKGVFHLVPSSCYYLGTCAEQLDKKSLAGYYYEKGSSVALELAKLKFPLKGERLLIVNAYIQFLQNNPSIDITSPEHYDFSFAIGKTLKEIRAAFQETLLDIMLKKTGTVRNAIKHLDIAERTYSKTRERNRSINTQLYSDSIEAFIHENDSLTWKAINKKFDDHILHYLYNQNGMNKKLLSQSLGVNYSRMVTRFKEIHINTDMERDHQYLPPVSGE